MISHRLTCTETIETYVDYPHWYAFTPCVETTSLRVFERVDPKAGAVLFCVEEIHHHDAPRRLVRTPRELRHRVLDSRVWKGVPRIGQVFFTLP